MDEVRNSLRNSLSKINKKLADLKFKRARIDTDIENHQKKAEALLKGLDKLND